MMQYYLLLVACHGRNSHSCIFEGKPDFQQGVGVGLSGSEVAEWLQTAQTFRLAKYYKIKAL